MIIFKKLATMNNDRSCIHMYMRNTMLDITDTVKKWTFGSPKW